VQSGDLFGFIDSVPSIGYAIREMGAADLKIAGRFDEVRELGVGVRNDDPVLLSIMQKAVSSIGQHEHQIIRSKWAPVEYVNSVDYRLVVWIVIISLFVLGFVVYRHHTLRRYNQKIQLAYAAKEQSHQELLEKTAELEKISATDSLTRAYNRMKMSELLGAEFSRVKRYGGGFAVMMIDLDHFKLVNDTYGHPVGDQVLIQVTKLIRKELRASDSLGRWGGEEFIVLCPGIGLEGALQCAVNLRALLASTVFEDVGSQRASFGVAAYTKGDTVDSILSRADTALYQAKDNGRNQVSGLRSS